MVKNGVIVTRLQILNGVGLYIEYLDIDRNIVSFIEMKLHPNLRGNIVWVNQTLLLNIG